MMEMTDKELKELRKMVILMRDRYGHGGTEATALISKLYLVIEYRKKARKAERELQKVVADRNRQARIS